MIAQVALDFFKGLFQRMDLRLSVEFVEQRDNQLIYQINGEAKSLTTELINHLNRLGSQVLNQARDQARDQAQNQIKENNLVCILDVNGKLKQREALLSVIASDVADVVTHSNRRAVVEGLNASERRVVHQQLSENQEVSTKSEGDGDYRYLIVSVKRS
jgi:spoIIIJ-associated protein